MTSARDLIGPGNSTTQQRPEMDFLEDISNEHAHWFLSRIERLAHHFEVVYTVQKHELQSIDQSISARNAHDKKREWAPTQQLVVEHHYLPAQSSEGPKMGPTVFKSPWRSSGIYHVQSIPEAMKLSADVVERHSRDISASVVSRRPDASAISCTYCGTYARCNISNFSYVADHTQQLASQMKSELEQTLREKAELQLAVATGDANPPQAPHGAAEKSVEQAGICTSALPPLVPGASQLLSRTSKTSEQLEAETMQAILSTSLRCMPSAESMKIHADASQQAVRVRTIRAAFLGSGQLLADSTLPCPRLEAACVSMPSNAQVMTPGATLVSKSSQSHMNGSLQRENLTIVEYLNLKQHSVFLSTNKEPTADDLKNVLQAAGEALNQKLL